MGKRKKVKIRKTKNRIRVTIKPKGRYSKIRTHDIGRPGHTQRIAGKRKKDGRWETHVWSFLKSDIKKGKGKAVDIYKRVTGENPRKVC